MPDSQVPYVDTAPKEVTTTVFGTVPSSTQVITKTSTAIVSSTPVVQVGTAVFDTIYSPTVTVTQQAHETATPEHPCHRARLVSRIVLPSASRCRFRTKLNFTSRRSTRPSAAPRIGLPMKLSVDVLALLVASTMDLLAWTSAL